MCSRRSLSSRTIISIFLVSLFVFLFPSCERTRITRKKIDTLFRTEVVLGTLCSVNLFEHGSEERYEEIFERLRQIEEVFSVNLIYSEISKVNAMAGIEPVAVSDDFIRVAKRSLIYAEITGGYFDPTIGPLVKLWGINTPQARVPSEEEIIQTLPLVNWRDFIIDEKAKTAFLQRPKMALDFGGIAKGYAADEVVAMLKSEEFPALIDLGGNVYLAGHKKDNAPWNVGIKNPLNKDGAVAALSLGGNLSAVTSGTYERFMDRGGKIYHHILNPKTGRPARPGMFSVTVVCPSSIDADALSTSLFIMGKEKGFMFLEALSHNETYADLAAKAREAQIVYITLHKEIISSDRLTGKIRLLSPDFKISE